MALAPSLAEDRRELVVTQDALARALPARWDGCPAIADPGSTFSYAPTRSSSWRSSSSAACSASGRSGARPRRSGPRWRVVRVEADALRDGTTVAVPVDDLVRGDIVLLNAGDIVTGDCVVIESRRLLVDEAALTGETYPVEKAPGVVPADSLISDRTNAVFMGTHVASGSGSVLSPGSAPRHSLAASPVAWRSVTS